MFWHWLLAPVILFANTAFGLLPPWNLQIGFGYLDGASSDQSLDHSYIHYLLLDLAPFDRFIPLHDAVLPLITLAVLAVSGLLAFKFVKFGLSLIPGISAGG